MSRTVGSGGPWRPLRVAMIGARGVPATWGGVERHVEEVGARLVERGHEVTVYSRLGYSEPVDTYRGMRVVTIPVPDKAAIEAMWHSLRSAARARRENYDVVHYHAVGPGLAAPVTRFSSRAAVVQTIHGLDSARAKWGFAQRQVLSVGTWTSARLPAATVVVSKDLQRHYRERYDRRTTYIPNGVTPLTAVDDPSALEALGLAGQEYLLYVGRLVPEKGADVLLRAFASVDTDAKLVIVGGSSHTDAYVDELRRLAERDPRVVMAGPVFGAALATVYQRAAAFVLPSLLEGLPLTLLEAASHELPLVVSTIPPHLEVVGTDEQPGIRLASPGSVPELKAALEATLRDLPEERRWARKRSPELLSPYNWEVATSRLDELYQSVLR